MIKNNVIMNNYHEKLIGVLYFTLSFFYLTISGKRRILLCFIEMSKVF